MIEKRIIPKQFQSDFLDSKARFPAFEAGWGSGKTMFGIMKGLGLSEAYPNNLGLICRKKFVDLRDSTMRDFTKYTNIPIPMSTKEITLPNGSVIMFRHADELSALQNINLGWAMIEQAEEFDTDESFQMLRGRLRRDGCFHQILTIANKNGHNWLWKMWEKKEPTKMSESLIKEIIAETGLTLEEVMDADSLDQYELHQATSFENKDNLPRDTIMDWVKMKAESPRKYRRFIMNSSDEYDIEGAYYANQMSGVLREKRSGIKNLYDPHAQVYTFWDLGVQDLTVVVAVQFIGKEIHIVNYWEDSGEGLDYYVDKLLEWGYSYAEHWFPQDVKARMQGKEIKTRLDILRDLLKNKGDINIVQPHRVIERIEEVWGILDKCWFDEKAEPLVEALAHYQKKKNETLSTEGKPVFADTPLHDWASHPADAFGYMAMVYRYQLQIDSQRVGWPHAISANVGMGRRSYDRLRHGVRIGA